MRKKINSVQLGLLLLLTSCAPSVTIGNLIPADAVVVFQIEKPQEYFVELDQFVQPLGVTNGKSLLELLKENDAFANFRLDSLKWDQSWAAALVKSAGNQLGIMLYLPINPSDQNVEQLKKIVAKQRDLKILFHGNYAVIHSRLENDPQYPLKDSFDMKKLAVEKKNGLKLYIDTMALRKHLFNNNENVDRLMTLSLTKDFQASQQNLAKLAAEVLSKVIKELYVLQSNLVTTGEGLSLWLRSDWKKEGQVQQFLSGAETRKSGEFLKYLDSSALVSTVISLPADKKEWLVDGGLTSLFADWNVKEKDSKFLREQCKKLLSLQGNRAAFNFDVDYDIQQLLLAFVFGVPSSNQLAQSFQVRISGVTEAENYPQHQEALKALWTSQEFSRLTAAVFHKADLPIHLTGYLKEEKTGKGMKYSKLQFRAELDQPNESNFLLTQTLAMYNVFLEQLPGYFNLTGQKLYFAFGASGLNLLENLVENDRLPKSWLESADYKRWQVSLSDESAVTGNVSLSRLAELLKKTPFSGSDLVPELKPSLGMLYQVRILPEGRLETALFWSEEEIAALTKHFVKTLPQMDVSRAEN